MAKIEDCPGFETFGADIKEARKSKRLTRKDLAEKVNVELHKESTALRFLRLLDF